MAYKIATELQTVTFRSMDPLWGISITRTGLFGETKENY